MPTPPLTEKEIARTVAAFEKHGSTVAAAKELGLAESTVRRRLERARSLRPATEKRKVGLGLAEFRAAHDRSYIIPNKIREALKSLGDSWMYEANFIRLAGITSSDLAAYRDEFHEHVVSVDRTRRVWAGTVSFARKLREMVS